MQSVALGALAYRLTRDARYVALQEFVRLAPVLLLSLIGGALADAVDRRRLLVVTQTEMMVVAFALAWVTRHDDPNRVAILACVLALGIGNSLNNPVQSTLLPHLVGMRDLPGAVALQSTQMNLSRVIGPAIGALIYPVVHDSGIFIINGLTYLFLVGVLFVIPRPPKPTPTGETGVQRLLAGFREARRNPLIGRILITLVCISSLCLPFIGLMPVLAAENLGIAMTGDKTYGFLFGTFGLGAATGAISIGTWLATKPRAVLVRIGLGGFSVALAAFGSNHWLPLAFPLIYALGFFYFGTITSLNTLLQEHLDERIRGRVMALWIMGFGGIIPFGLLGAGFIARATSMTVVCLIGASVLAILCATTDLRRHVVAASANE